MDAARALARSEPVFADFVRRSVRMLARERARGPDLDDPEGLALCLLAHRNAEQWFPNPPGTRLALRRGFPETLGLISLDRWLTDGPGLRARYPILEIQTKGAAGRCEQLSPTLGGIQALTLAGCGLVDDDIRALFSHPAAAGLVWLDLSGNNLRLDALEVLARAAPRLRWLGFACNAIPDPTVQWADHDGLLVPELTGDPREARARCGPVPWLSCPPFQASFQDPQLYYPLSDLAPCP